ncbi:hypothetical protein BYT27DRAFT_6379761 [Phlegmacium glaucopus]|nr:hypothetical protein BYT27DRAFT_6379761 [Phlegmacium glaucopus]
MKHKHLRPQYCWTFWLLNQTRNRSFWFFLSFNTRTEGYPFNHTPFLWKFVFSSTRKWLWSYQVTKRSECCCPRKKILTFRYSVRGKSMRHLSCGNTCSRNLSCGKEGSSRWRLWKVFSVATCWCGKEQSMVDFGGGGQVQVFVTGESINRPRSGGCWVGNICQRC